jgi:uncharacterized membrane protein YfcA
MWPAAHLAYKDEYSVFAAIIGLVACFIFFYFFYGKRKKIKEEEKWKKILEESRDNKNK